jgi:hypothetical protein
LKKIVKDKIIISNWIVSCSCFRPFDNTSISFSLFSSVFLKFLSFNSIKSDTHFFVFYFNSFSFDFAVLLLFFSFCVFVSFSRFSLRVASCKFPFKKRIKLSFCEMYYFFTLFEFFSETEDNATVLKFLLYSAYPLHSSVRQKQINKNNNFF